MTMSVEDQQLVADMRQRQFHIKKYEIAKSRIHYESVRYRYLLIVGAAVLTGVIVGAVAAAEMLMRHRSHYWTPVLTAAALGALLGALLGRTLLGTTRGRHLLDRRRARLRRKYFGDLESGRRWLSFYYDGEDIAGHIPQILYVLDSEHRFDSVRAAVDFVKEHSRRNPLGDAHALEKFDDAVARTNRVAVATLDAEGRPSCRIMNFVTTGRPGVWYITTAPDAPKVVELDRRAVALVTVPTESGVTISSNRVRITRSGRTFAEIADLYRDQVPGYTDSMTPAEEEHELVYELVLESAKVDTWLDSTSVLFPE